MTQHDAPFPDGRPDRPPDRELFGEGPPPAGVADPGLGVVYAELFVDAMGHESHPRGWWAALIWLEDKPDVQ